MLNSFLAKREIVEILVNNQKAGALLSPAMRASINRVGSLSLAAFGYPTSVSARTAARDIFNIMSTIPEGSLVDVGCAFGAAHTFEFARRCAPHQVLGLDIDSGSIDIARRLNKVLGFDNLSFEVCDVAEYKANHHFDIVFTAETLEHIRDDVAVMQNLARMAKPTGWLVISVPYSECPTEFDAPQPAFGGHESDSGLFPGGFHWRSGYNEASLRELTECCGFKVVSVVHTKSVCVLPNRLPLFPANYLLSNLLSPVLGRAAKVNILARSLA